MTTIGAQPAKGPSTQWSVMIGVSPQTHAVLHPHGGKHYRLWSRLHEGQRQFAALPVEQDHTAIEDPKTDIHQALQVVLVQAVKDHARKNYENGWDGIVECYEDKDILEAIGGATTIRGAINAVGRRVRIHDSVRRDVQGEIF